MPRQIIDTESSRPAYRRRQMRNTLVVLAAIAVLLIAAYAVWARFQPAPVQVRPASPAGTHAHAHNPGETF